MVVSRQPYNVARWKGGRQMRKTAQPHAQKRGMFLHHEHEMQNGFQAVSHLQI